MSEEPYELMVLRQDLEAEIRGLPARYALVEIGTYIEAAEAAAGKLFGLDGSVRTTEWHTEFAKRGMRDVGVSDYSSLRSIPLPTRNEAAHANFARLWVPPERVTSVMAEVRLALPRAAVEFQPLGDFIGELRERQAHSSFQGRASRLERALLSLPASARLFEAVSRFASSHLPPEVARHLLKASPEKRLRRELVALARSQVRDECQLRALAAILAPEWPAIRSWQLADEAILSKMTRRTSAMPAIRIVVMPAPEGWQVTDATLLAPRVQRTADDRPFNPVSVRNWVELRRAITTAITELTKLGRTVGGPQNPTGYLLRLATTPEHATADFELLQVDEDEAPLWEVVRGVIVEPITEYCGGAVLPEPIFPDEHVAMVWGAEEPAAIRARAGDKVVLMVGPDAWKPRPGRKAAVVAAMESRAAAVLTDYATCEDARTDLMPAQCSLEQMLQLIRESRPRNRRIKVLCTDDYSANAL